MAEKKTIWQTLNNVLNSEANPMALEPDKGKDAFEQKPKNDGLITANNKEDFELKKLEHQQTKYLNDQYKQVSNDRYQLSVFYETTRYASYIDFEMMEYFPEIAAALDIMSEESTCLHDNGKMLDIRSNSERIKKILEHLFYSILNINANLPAWVRNTTKYGDNFIYLESEKGRGITAAEQLTNIEIKRVEGNIFKKDEKKKTVFEWKKGNLEFQNFQIAHFRLVGDDKKLPYGTCLKYNTRIKTLDGFKEIKDVIKGDEVYSFDIDSQKQIYSKVLDTVNSGKKECYKISTKHNFIDVSKEHKILIYDKIKENFVYKNTLDLKIGDFLIIDKLSDNNSLIPINKTKPIFTKNGYWGKIDLVPDYVNEEFAQLFGFIIGDGWLHNNTIAIAYGDHLEINKTYIKLLEKFSGKEVKNHKSFYTKEIRQGVCNSKMLVTILERMGLLCNADLKRIPKWVYNTSIEIRKAFLKGLIDADGSLFIDKWNCLRFCVELVNEELIQDIKILAQSLGYKTGKICKRKKLRGNKLLSENRNIIGKHLSYYFYFYESENKQSKKHDITNRKTDDFILEKIISIEKTELNETYDIYVENDNHNFYANGIVVHNSVLEKARKIWKMLSLAEDAMMVYRLSRAPERRVFKIDVGNIDDKDVENYVQKVAAKFKKTTQVNQNNGQIDLRYNVLTQDEDYFIPVRNNINNTVIDTLPGAQNLDQISDISFLQNKLFAALRVPKTFLGFAEATGDGKNLSMQDVRFARTINRIQQAMLMELNKIAIIHLHLLGFTEDWNNFTLALANPSSQAEMLKLEILGIKLDTYIKAVSDAGNGFSAFSMTKAKKEILNMSEDEIVLDLQQQRIEKAEALRNSPEVLATKQLNSGMFDTMDKRYKDNGESINNSMENPEGPGGSPAPGGGGMPTMPSGGEEGLPPPDGEEGLPGQEGPEIPGAPGGMPPMPGEQPTTIKEGVDFVKRNDFIRKNIEKSLKSIDKIINE